MTDIQEHFQQVLPPPAGEQELQACILAPKELVSYLDRFDKFDDAKRRELAGLYQLAHTFLKFPHVAQGANRTVLEKRIGSQLGKHLRNKKTELFPPDLKKALYDDTTIAPPHH